MAVRVSGNFGRLEDLIERFKRLATEQEKRALLANLAEEANTQIALGFRESRDPNGAPWAPLKLRTGQPLRDTGRLAASLRAKPLPSAIAVDVTGRPAKYFRVHQFGAVIVPLRGKVLRWRVRGSRKYFVAKRVRIPQRRMLPGDELGPIWRRAFEDVVSHFLNEGFRAR